MKTLEAKRRARAEEYYKRKKYLQVRRERGCGLVHRFSPSVSWYRMKIAGWGPGNKAEDM